MNVIDVKQAVAVASQFMAELMGGRISDVLLEEVEHDDSANERLVTLSASTPITATNKLGEIFPRDRRIFRQIAVNANNAEVRAMKSRKLDE